MDCCNILNESNILEMYRILIADDSNTLTSLYGERDMDKMHVQLTKMSH